MPGAEPLIRLESVNHSFREGGRRRQILFDITTRVQPGEIVLITGPSGSGKTTALTLVGALRSTQEGSLQVLGHELAGAKESALVKVRRQIGYIFQQHNLIDSLTVAQNVQMGLALQPDLQRREIRERLEGILDDVGIGDQIDKYPTELSGGQKQRVGIARALVGRPRIILADEPTASLDRKSGRDAVALMRALAREQDVTVVLVTHDNRILDVADRILHLEDGRLVSFNDAVLDNTRHMMQILANYNRKGELVRRVAELPADEFLTLLEEVTEEAKNFVRVSEMARDETFQSMMEQVLQAFTLRIGELLNADRASLFLVDEARGELWSEVARDAGGEPIQIRIPRDSGIAGAVAASGRSANVADVYGDPRFDRSVDQETGYRTRNLLAIPLRRGDGQVFGVAELLNRRDGQPFGPDDEHRFAEFMESMSVILDSWWQMSEARRSPSD